MSFENNNSPMAQLADKLKPEPPKPRGCLFGELMLRYATVLPPDDPGFGNPEEKPAINGLTYEAMSCEVCGGCAYITHDGSNVREISKSQTTADRSLLVCSEYPAHALVDISTAES